MLRLWRLVKFANAVLAAERECRNKLAPLGGWTVTGIGEVPGYHVRDGVVTEWKAYWALRDLQHALDKAMDDFRLMKR